MSVIEVVSAVVVAVLSVIGLLSVVRVGLEALWMPRAVSVAVVLRASEGAVEPEVLDLYLGEAVRHPARRRGERLLVLAASSLVSPDGTLDEEAMTVIERYGASLIVVADGDLNV